MKELESMVGLMQIASILFASFGRRLQLGDAYHVPISMCESEDNGRSTCRH